jgi:hypothetical protein
MAGGAGEPAALLLQRSIPVSGLSFSLPREAAGQAPSPGPARTGRYSGGACDHAGRQGPVFEDEALRGH